MVSRLQIKQAQDRLFKGKALIILGPRQAGKTTFTEQLLKAVNKSVLRLNGDNYDTLELLEKPNVGLLKNIIGNHEIIFIDEAQRIPSIGILIKIIVDQLKPVQVIATGSSSFDLSGKVNEPLTGRKYEIELLPFAYSELKNDSDFLSEKRLLEQRLIYGSYPEIVSNPAKTEEHLQLLTSSYLYKDLFALEKIQKPKTLEKLVKALALQVGSEVSMNELSKLIGVSNKTIDKYISLLEMAFVIFNLDSFSKNVRNELRKSRKIYFIDNGVLNAVIGNFNGLKNRNDHGALWENYLMSERRKALNLTMKKVNRHFWRTTQQQEIDYLEVTTNDMKAFEFKWSSTKSTRFSKTFLKAYPEATSKIITPDNYHEFLEFEGKTV